jgi:hypothetical protein
MLWTHLIITGNNYEKLQQRKGKLEGGGKFIPGVNAGAFFEMHQPDNTRCPVVGI